MAGDIHRFVEDANDLDGVTDLPVDHEVAWREDLSNVRSDMIAARYQVDDADAVAEFRPGMRSRVLRVGEDLVDRRVDQLFVSVPHRRPEPLHRPFEDRVDVRLGFRGEI